MRSQSWKHSSSGRKYFTLRIMPSSIFHTDSRPFGFEPWKQRNQPTCLPSPTGFCFECGTVTSDSFCVHTLTVYALWSRLKYYDGPPQPSTCWSFLRHSISFPDRTLARNGASVSSRLSRHSWFRPKRYLERINYPATFGTARAVQVALH